MSKGSAPAHVVMGTKGAPSPQLRTAAEAPHDPASRIAKPGNQGKTGLRYAFYCTFI